jgi:hypothetical protein
MPVFANNPQKTKYTELLNAVGRNAIHTLFPNDFEAYFVSLELVDSNNNTESFFTFPIQPSQISETNMSITNIKKTSGGIVAISTDTFIPKDIEIKGDFGRQLRFALGASLIAGSSVLFNKEKNSSLTLKKAAFSNSVKTGYGSLKALEAILNDAEQLDSFEKPKKLYLYNPILGNNYLVKKKLFSHSQNISTNMIPQYNLQLTAVAPMESAIDSLRDSINDFIGSIDTGTNSISRKIVNIFKAT